MELELKQLKLNPVTVTVTPVFFKVLDYFLRSNKSNINQNTSTFVPNVPS